LPLHARSDTVVRAYDGPTRGRAPVADGASGEGVVAPRLCPRPPLQGRTATGGSMPRTLTSALPHATPGSEVLLQGWVHRRRELAQVTLLVVRDRTGLAEVVLPPGTDLPPEETPVSVTG